MRRAISFFLAFLLTGPISVYAARPDKLEITVGDLRIDRYGASYVLGAEVMVPLSEAAFALGAECVAFDSAEGAAYVYMSGLKVRLGIGDKYIVANGRYIYCPGGVVFRWNRVMVAASSVAEAMGAGYEYNKVSGAVTITAGAGKTRQISWTQGDLYWLSRIVNAEARGESLEGKIAVANVVLNRVKSDEFPDDIESVIFDRRFGVQFTPIEDGSIYNMPTEESILAARLALDGADVAGDSLYFASLAAAEYCWAERNRERYGEIDHQVFYL